MAGAQYASETLYKTYFTADLQFETAPSRGGDDLPEDVRLNHALELLQSGRSGAAIELLRPLADDGNLTGYEISLTDLSRTRLVVLSACRTALGDNDYSEGVYGLQRAFRMAGAQALLVTLWEIPDRETTRFMTGFYERLVQGTGIRDAFDATMRAMRRQYPSDPEVWAGFVLIE